jgi:hypothetical protein
MTHWPRRLLPAAALGAALVLGTAGCDRDFSKPVTETVPRTRQQVQRIEQDRRAQVDELDRMEAESRQDAAPADSDE